MMRDPRGPRDEARPSDELDAALASLKQQRHEPPADLVDRAVLRAVQARAAAVERDQRPWRWAARTAAGLTVLGVATLGVVFAAMNLRDARPPSASAVDLAAPTSPSTNVVDVDVPVPVRFVLPAAGAHAVAVAGEFNGWDASQTPLRDEDGDGVFHTTLSLERGAYAYMFVIDGERWVTDPFADAYRDDGFGNRNAVLRIP